METKREFSIVQVAMLTGVDQNTLRGWMKAELLFPARKGKARGLGRTTIFDLRHVMVVGLLATLKRAGATLQYAGPVARFIGRHTPAELKQAADDDLLLVYAGAAMPPCFRRRNDVAEYRGDFPELGFQASMRDLWGKVESGLEYAARATASPLN